jgi:hypothetical protein
MNPANELDAMLADQAQQVQAIRDFQPVHGYECTATRTPARRMIALAKQWRSEVAARRDTLSQRRCYATAPAGWIDRHSRPTVCRREQRVPVSPAVGSRSNLVQRATLTYVEQAERQADADTEAAA